MTVVISGTGVFTPPNKVSNDALVEAFNAYVDTHNSQHSTPPLAHSSSAFIEKASGIKSRHFFVTEGVLDPNVMQATLPRREDDALSLHAEMALAAAEKALASADCDPQSVDCIIMACTNMQRPYPGIAIELQKALGASGFAFDMQVACSSATFGINVAYQHLRSGACKRVLVVTPEIALGQLNFKDRDSHFIFGDACSAILLEQASESRTPKYEVMSTHLKTSFSNNIRCNFGFLNRLSETGEIEPFFNQSGRKVFKEVIPLVIEHLSEHLGLHNLKTDQIARYWLHQANSNMNQLIAKKLLGDNFDSARAPIILDRYANTGGAGSIIAFHHHHDNLCTNDYGAICSFGAGYSVGSILVRKL